MRHNSGRGPERIWSQSSLHPTKVPNPKQRVEEIVKEVFDLRPAAIIEYLDLLRPIYRLTSAYGHFGRSEDEFTWEKTNKADIIREKAGL